MDGLTSWQWKHRCRWPRLRPCGYQGFGRRSFVPIQPVLRARPSSAETSVSKISLLFFAFHHVLVWEFNSFSFQHRIITSEKSFSCAPSLKLLKCVLVSEMDCCVEVGDLKIVKAIFRHYLNALVRSRGRPVFYAQCFRL